MELRHTPGSMQESNVSKRAKFVEEPEENWIRTDEADFWLYFFQLIDSREGSALEVEFNARLERCYERGINWDFWTGSSASSSYLAAVRKTKERIGKGFRRGEAAKLKKLMDKVLTNRKSQLDPESKSFNTHKHVLDVWVEMRTNLDNQPWDWARVTDLLFDIIVGCMACALFGLFLLGIYVFISKYK